MLKALIVASAVVFAGSAMAQWGSNSQNHQTQGHYRNNGTYVQPYHATNPNNTRTDNYSTQGNVNPYTGKPGTRRAW